MPDFTIEEIAKECDREAAMRRTVYSRQVRAGTLSKDLARKRLDMMTEAATRLRQLDKVLHPDQSDLFVSSIPDPI